MRPDLPARRSRFETALRDAGARHAGARHAGDALFDELVECYGEPHRRYHTLEHVAACLEWLDRLRESALRPAEVALALWFHDVVYRPASRSNERRSAQLAGARLAAVGIDRQACDRIARAIEATRTHDAVAGDAALVVEIDLAILGASPAAFDRFEAQIRQEYAAIPEPLFRAGRRRVLQRFLARPAIFQLPQLHAALETKARTNLVRRVRALDGA